MKELIGTYLVTRSETEMLTLNPRSKVHPSVPAAPGSSEKGYLRHTIESTNKQKIKKEQGKKKSPLRSPPPRLCEEEPEIYSLPDSNLQRKQPNHYHPQKYDDQQTQWGEKETFPHDNEIDLHEHKPRPPSGSSSSKTSRKKRLTGPKSLEKYEECLEKAKRANENNWVFLG